MSYNWSCKTCGINNIGRDNCSFCGKEHYVDPDDRYMFYEINNLIRRHINNGMKAFEILSGNFGRNYINPEELATLFIACAQSVPLVETARQMVITQEMTIEAKNTISDIIKGVPKMKCRIIILPNVGTNGITILDKKVLLKVANSYTGINIEEIFAKNNNVYAVIDQEQYRKVFEKYKFYPFNLPLGSIDEIGDA